MNPWLIGIDLRTGGTNSTAVELRLSIAILLYELQQCEVHLTKANILEFISNDIAKNQDKALAGYLTIARHVIDPPPIKKRLGWFARMFSRPPIWEPPQVRWNWIKVTEVKLLDGESLAINGVCCDTSTVSGHQPT